MYFIWILYLIIIYNFLYSLDIKFLKSFFCIQNIQYASGKYFNLAIKPNVNHEKNGQAGAPEAMWSGGAAISKGHLLLNHHFSGRQYLLKIYCMDIRLLYWGGGGGCIFIYTCSHTVKTITFKRNPSGRTQIYEYILYTSPPNYRV